MRSLEARVKEYEELFDLSSGKESLNSNNSSGNNNSGSNSEKLSTIAETASLEGQVILIFLLL